MKFELDDSTLLRVSGVAAVALGASALAVPRDYHNRLYATVRLAASPWTAAAGGGHGAPGNPAAARRPQAPAASATHCGRFP